MKKCLPLTIAFLAALLAYANTFGNSFHFDDITSILQKPWIRGLDKIPMFIHRISERPLLILTLMA